MAGATSNRPSTSLAGSACGVSSGIANGAVVSMIETLSGWLVSEWMSQPPMRMRGKPI
jgi:hypothetical protein